MHFFHRLGAAYMQSTKSINKIIVQFDYGGGDPVWYFVPTCYIGGEYPAVRQSILLEDRYPPQHYQRGICELLDWWSKPISNAPAIDAEEGECSWVHGGAQRLLSPDTAPKIHSPEYPKIPSYRKLQILSQISLRSWHLFSQGAHAPELVPLVTTLANCQIQEKHLARGLSF